METQSSFASLVRLMRYARGYRRRVILASASSIINKLFDIAPEILIGIAIDVVVNQDTSFVAGFGFETAQQQILVLAVLTFFIWAGESLFQYFYLVLWRNLAQDLQADMRLGAYEHMQRQSMGFFEERSTGDLVAVLNDDVNQLERFLDGGANDLIQVFVSVIAVGAVFFYLSPIIALLAFSPIPVIVWGAFYFLRETQLPPVESLRSQQVPIAIATDCNPGSSPLASMLLTLNMACTLFRLTPEEALDGATRHAAAALGLNDCGVLAPGKRADLAIWNVNHPAELAYRIGYNPLHERHFGSSS